MKKNNLTHEKSSSIAAVTQGMSKDAIVDCLGDLMDLATPNWSIEDLINTLAPRLVARGEKEPPSWKEGILRRLPIHRSRK